MKKSLLTLVAGVMAFIGLSVAIAQIVVKTTPVVITREGDYYVVPENTPETTEYYSYTADNTNYVCSAVQPTELATVQSLPIAVRLGTTTSNVYCYPSTYYTVTP